MLSSAQGLLVSLLLGMVSFGEPLLYAVCYIIPLVTYLDADMSWRHLEPAPIYYLP